MVRRRFSSLEGALIVRLRRLCRSRRVKSQGIKVDGDEQTGVDVIKRACEEPIRQIVNDP